MEGLVLKEEVGGRHKEWMDDRLPHGHKRTIACITVTDNFTQRSGWTPATAVHFRLHFWLESLKQVNKLEISKNFPTYYVEP